MITFINTAIRKIVINYLFVPLFLFAVNSHGDVAIHFLTEMDLDESVEGQVVKYMHKDLVLYSAKKSYISDDQIDGMTVKKVGEESYDLFIEFRSRYRLDFSGPLDKYSYLAIIDDSKIIQIFNFSFSPSKNTLQIKGFESKHSPVSIMKQIDPDPVGYELADVVAYFSKVTPLPRFIYQYNEEYLGDAWELGVMLYSAGCNYGCGGGGYGPTMRYGRSNNIEKYFLGYSLFAGMGSIDGGGVMIEKSNNKKIFGAEVNARLGVFIFTFTGAEGEFHFNTGLGI
ncbi:MAG: hypothetical protein V7765_17115 [Oleispira sp.]